MPKPIGSVALAMNGVYKGLLHDCPRLKQAFSTDLLKSHALIPLTVPLRLYK